MGDLINRRLFLAGGFSLAGPSVSAPSDGQRVYRFATADCDIQMSVEFHDRYSSRGFHFNDRLAGRHFCLSLNGDEVRDCDAHFVGSLAIARYSIRPRSGLAGVSILREHVRTIDQDARLHHRPPFDRRMELQHGAASDIQAFGYEASSAPELRIPDAASPWYYFRQDLYLEPHTAPFLIIHWKHALSAIRMLDIIPGDGTRPVNK